MLRAVGFDLWETLITNTPDDSRLQSQERLEAMERVLRTRGVAFDPARFHDAYREQWSLCQDLYWSADVDIPCRRQVEHCLELLPKGGLLFVTVPFSYPHHRDPIDTMYRPSPGELARLFAGARLLEGRILGAGVSYRDAVREAMLEAREAVREAVRCRQQAAPDRARPRTVDSASLAHSGPRARPRPGRRRHRSATVRSRIAAGRRRWWGC